MDTCGCLSTPVCVPTWVYWSTSECVITRVFMGTQACPCVCLHEYCLNVFSPVCLLMCKRVLKHVCASPEESLAHRDSVSLPRLDLSPSGLPPSQMSLQRTSMERRKFLLAASRPLGRSQGGIQRCLEWEQSSWKGPPAPRDGSWDHACWDIRGWIHLHDSAAKFRHSSG